MLDDHISALEKALELDTDIPQEDEGVWRLWLDMENSVVITDKEPGYHFYQELGAVGNRNLEELFTVFLVNNYFGQGTGGSVLGLDESGKQATLSFTREQDADYKDFERDLEEFINYAEFWQREIDSHQEESTSAYL